MQQDRRGLFDSAGRCFCANLRWIRNMEGRAVLLLRLFFGSTAEKHKKKIKFQTHFGSKFYLRDVGSSNVSACYGMLHCSVNSFNCNRIAISSSAIEVLQGNHEKIKFSPRTQWAEGLTDANLKILLFRQNSSGPRDLTKLMTVVKTIFSQEKLLFWCSRCFGYPTRECGSDWTNVGQSKSQTKKIIGFQWNLVLKWIRVTNWS